jgi:hypothetical protein
MKLGKLVDFGGKTAKAIAGLGISITIAALTEIATERVTAMNVGFIDKKVKGIKNVLKLG